MKKLIFNALVFFPLLFISYIFLIIAWGSYAPGFLKKNLEYRRGSFGHLFTRIAEAKKTKDVDILFLGSSHTYRGFDPRIFEKHGFKTFSLASSSQTPLQTEILLERYIKQLNPKTIIYEVYPTTFLIDGVESSLDIIANDTIDTKILKMSFQLNNIKTYNALIYGSYRQLFGLNKNYKERLVKDVDTYISGGYIERAISYYDVRSENYNYKKTWSPRKIHVNAFEKILAIAHEKNIRVILVQAPVTKIFFNIYTNNAAIDSYFSSKGEYYNFNSLLKMNDSLHFFNADHLNQDGVSVFNEFLIANLLRKESFQKN